MKKFLYFIFDFIIIFCIFCTSKMIAISGNFSTDMIWFCGAVGGVLATFMACLLKDYRN